MSPLFKAFFSFFLHIKCAQSCQLCSKPLEFRVSKVTAAISTDPFGTEGVLSHSIISNCLCRQFCIKQLPFHLSCYFHCWGCGSELESESAHCAADLAQAGLCRAAPVPEHLEFIKFIYSPEWLC